jgi:hypothetical protein
MHAWEERIGISAVNILLRRGRSSHMPTISSWAAFISVLVDRLVDVYMHITDAKELWDALVAKYDATDAGSELYTMESFHDFRMVNNRSVVEQAHEIQILVKELELLKCPLT